MEFTIKQKALNEALSFVAGGLDAKMVIPVLAFVLIESCGENAVQITTTNLDLTIRRTAEAEILKTGTILVQARKLAEIVRSLPDGECRFTKDKNDWVTMTHGRSKYRFAGTPRQNFPEIPSYKSTPISVEAATLQELVRRTAFAVDSSNSGRLNYATKENIKLEVKDGHIRLVGVEGNCMSIAERPIETDIEVDRIVPKKAFVEAAKIDKGKIRIGGDDNHIFIESDDQLIISRTVAMQFPAYEKAIPEDADKIASFGCDEMRLAIQRAAVMADSRNLTIRMTVKPGEVVITSATRDEGDVTEIVDAAYEGNEVIFGFFHRYITEFLKVANSKEPITFKFAERPNTPCLMSIDGDDGFTFVVVPLNLEVQAKQEAAKERKAA